MSRHLFIGGASDGKTLDVEPGINFVRREGPQPPAQFDTYELFEDTVFNAPIARIETYRRERFAVGAFVAAEIFVIQGLSTEGMFQVLIEGYRQGLPADPDEKFQLGFDRGVRHGLAAAAQVIERDAVKGDAPIWDVFRDRCVQLIRAFAK